MGNVEIGEFLMRFNLWDTNFGDCWDNHTMVEAINSKITKKEDIVDNIEFWQKIHSYDKPFSYKLCELIPEEAREMWEKQYGDI